MVAFVLQRQSWVVWIDSKGHRACDVYYLVLCREGLPTLLWAKAGVHSAGLSIRGMRWLRDRAGMLLWCSIREVELWWFHHHHWSSSSSFELSSLFRNKLEPRPQQPPQGAVPPCHPCCCSWIHKGCGCLCGSRFYQACSNLDPGGREGPTDLEDPSPFAFPFF